MGMGALGPAVNEQHVSAAWNPTAGRGMCAKTRSTEMYGLSTVTMMSMHKTYRGFASEGGPHEEKRPGADRLYTSRMTLKVQTAGRGICVTDGLLQASWI